MDYSKGMTRSYYAMTVDPETWADLDRIEIVSGSINRTDTDLRQNATITVREYDNTLERWIRIYMDAKQGQEVAHVPLFTGIATSPQSDFQDGVDTITLQCYSVLKAAADDPLMAGFYISTTGTGTDHIRELLELTPAPTVVRQASDRLTDEIIAEANESRVTLTDKILKVTDRKLQIDGDGTIYVVAPTEEPAAIFSPEYDVMETSFTKGRDWFSCPNFLRVTSGNLTAVARDDDPNSELSTVARGRTIGAPEETGVTLENGESVGQYAKRRLKELQQRTETLQYTRRFIPGVNIGDTVRMSYADPQGDYKVTSQTITLDATGSTSESVQRTK